MNIKNRHIIVYSFQSLEDPLLKGLMLEYLLKINLIHKNLHIHLISHEQKQYALNKTDAHKKQEDLKKINIFWYPVQYKTGRFLLIKKLFNFIETFLICCKIKFKYRPKAIIGFLSIAGGYSYIISKIFSLKLVIFCFEPHSEYMVDFNVWSKNSLKYKLLKKFEYLQIKNASYITVPTLHTLKMVNDINASSKKYLVPISINTNLFKFSQYKRDTIRNLMSANDKIIIIYTGKFGGIYYDTDTVSNFFKKLYSINPDYFLFVITPNISEINESLSKYKLPEKSYFVQGIVPLEDLSGYISAADIGLIAIPPLPSQKYRTPVKTGIYLSCGIPYIVNKGIAEDDVLAEKENVGIVIENIDTINSNELNKQIKLLFSEDNESLKERCIKIALQDRDIKNSISALSDIINDLFIH